MCMRVCVKLPPTAVSHDSYYIDKIVYIHIFTYKFAFGLTGRLPAMQVLRRLTRGIVCLYVGGPPTHRQRCVRPTYRARGAPMCAVARGIVLHLWCSDMSPNLFDLDLYIMSQRMFP